MWPWMFKTASLNWSAPLVESTITAGVLVSTNDRPQVESDHIPRELLELGRRLSLLERPHYDHLHSSYLQVVDFVVRRKHILLLVQEALSRLRVENHSLKFDLDATRQERDQLRASIEENGLLSGKASWDKASWDKASWDKASWDKASWDKGSEGSS